MAEYIEREALIAELAKGTIISGDLYGMGIMSGVDFAMKKIVEQPATDVAPVVHGRWTEKDHSTYDPFMCDNVHWSTFACSECNGEVMADFNYCPNCGAKMDGERKDGEG